MTTLTDGMKVAKISMHTVSEGSTSVNPDFSADFFEVGSLPCLPDGSHFVQDLEYCIEQAYDWQERKGDFACDESEDFARIVNVSRETIYGEVID